MDFSSRVLIIPVMENDKEETRYQKVWVMSFNSELYDFDELVKHIDC